MYVHRFKQEVATTWKTGSSYITYISGSVNGPSAVAPKSGVCLYQIPSIFSIQSRKMIGDMHICTYTSGMANNQVEVRDKLANKDEADFDK